jgi:hypothetical protein
MGSPLAIAGAAVSRGIDGHLDPLTPRDRRPVIGLLPVMLLAACASAPGGEPPPERRIDKGS